MSIPEGLPVVRWESFDQKSLDDTKNLVQRIEDHLAYDERKNQHSGITCEKRGSSYLI